MIRGTTPTLEFAIPFDTSLISEAFVTLAQNGAVVVDKPLKECNCSGNKLTVRLTQEETLKLQENDMTEVQLRARTVNGEAVASQIFRDSTERILKDGVI